MPYVLLTWLADRALHFFLVWQAWDAHSNEVHSFLANRASTALTTAVKAAVEKFGKGSVKDGSPMRLLNGKFAYHEHGAASPAQAFVVQEVCKRGQRTILAL
jgi:hypothetical protein